MRPTTEHESQGDHRPGMDERGASLVEYALLVALMAVVVVSALSAFGGQVGDMYSDANDTMASHIQG